MTRCITILVVVLLAVVPVWADLAAYTGGSYTWTAYNNLTASLGQSLPPNVTGLGVDEDRPGGPSSGELVDYSTGLGVAVMLEPIKPTGYLWVDRTEPQNPGLIFADTLGGSYTGNVIAHNGGTQQLLRFTGLDPDATYTFAGVATAPSNHHDSLSTVQIVGADAATNESVLTSGGAGYGSYHSGPLQDYPGFGMTPDVTYLSYLEDDVAIWSGIDPGDDGEVSILLTSVLIGYREWAPAMDAIVLARESDGEIPEPSTALLLALAAGGGLRRRR